MERRVAGQRDLVEGLLFGLIASGCVLAEGIEFSCIIFAFFCSHQLLLLGFAAIFGTGIQEG